MTATAEGRRLVAAVERSEERTTTVDAFLGELSAQVGKVVPFDGAMWFGVDPSTLLALTPSRVQNMDPALCWTFWHGEFNTSDALQFRDLARQERPVGALRLATGGTPVRSARYRDFLQPQGYADEARVAFRTGPTTWAVAALYRDKGRDPFTSNDLEVLLAASPAVGAALRRFSIRASAPNASLLAPGVMLFGDGALLLSANREAREWLSHLYGPNVDDKTWDGLLADCSHPERLQLYTPLQPLVSRARAVARGHDEGPVRVRLRDRGGRWVVLHASCLDEHDGDGPVVVVVEPAKSAEVAPIIVEAYGLTPREREVVRGIATGLSTPEIAAELFLSAHTVRDYIKSVFEKVGVGSRGELVAKLFAEHYAETLHAGMVHADA
ncbi:LuxR C-terminal-related transcriptional regulator [Nocardioides sp. GCM10027113]|uniref:helix-turn-helix transcriptional regulator n=1 Tax=unclassified Nocardioides TaxID=2615069 RepID=UPI00360A6CD5